MSTKEAILSEDISSLIRHAKFVGDHIEGNINELEKHCKTIVNESEAHRNKLIQRVHDSFKELNIELTNAVKEQTQILAKTHRELGQHVIALSCMLKDLQQLTHSEISKRKPCIDLDKTAENVALVLDQIKRVSLERIDVRCDINMGIQPLVESKSKFGKVTVDVSVHQSELVFPDMQYSFMNIRKEEFQTVDNPQPELLQKVDNLVELSNIGKMNIKITDDTRDCYIRGIDLTDDGNIIIADFNNSKIKLYSPEENLLSFLKLFSKPKEVTVIKNSQAVISMLGKQMCKQIGIIDIGESGDLSWKGTIQTTYAVGGIAVYQDNLIITCDESADKLRAVQMIDMAGEVLWTVTKDKHGSNLFDFGRFLTIRYSKEGDTLIVTDVGKQSIIVIDALTGEVAKVCHVKEREPRGVCVDSLGNVYVCYKSGEITAWSGEMSEERCLVNDPDQLDCPLAMVYDNVRYELLVTSSSLTQDHFCNFIHHYKSC